ncbi:MAG: TonB-dependent receptor [Sphingopyxis sp.]|jgi:iron complex outermembrane receptor protein|nr:MAG: TonB-dependent receptor [Sphingopyxis sp.]|tara:strand:+ start:4266 stop:6518 length:2253 start_codon:yes stop_codon:yes gene_type:complete
MFNRKTAPRTYGGNAAIIALAIAAFIPSVEAQTIEQVGGEANADDDNIIIVTASKRSENLQDVPISLSAITGDALAASKTVLADELAAKVPNLQMNGTIGENVPIFALRGISMFDYSLNQSSPVATYYDEVYKGNVAFLGISMFDLERVEVLRGPQGTLYGKNTTGGAVNLISKAPELNDANGYARVGYGNYDRVDLDAAANLPLGNSAALRIAGTFSRANGWFENVLPNQPDLNGIRQYAVRGSLKVQPTDGIDFVLRASTSFQNPRNFGVFSEPEAINRPGLTRRQIASNETSRRKARTYAVSLTANAELNDALTLTSITSWDKGTIDLVEDTDGLPIQLLEIPNFDRATQFAQDLRLASDFAGPFNFILGAYYNREKVFNQTTFRLLQDVASGGDIDMDGDVDDDDCALTTVGEACQFRNSFTQIKKSFAIYSDLNYEITDNVTLRGGLRFTRDTGQQNDFIAEILGPSGTVLGATIPTPATPPSFRNSDLSGKIGIDFKTAGDDLIYASISRGYRAPSFNAQAFFDPSEVSVAEKETVYAYEIGAKSQFANNSVTLNLAGFYYDYRDQQSINVDQLTGAQTLLNIPKSRIFGGEAELTAYLNDSVTLRSAVGLLNTKIKRGIVNGIDISGNNLVNAPSLNFSGGFDVTAFDNGSGKLSLHGDLSYITSQFFEIVNVPRLEQNGYALLSGHINWKSANGRFVASIWGKNLTNKFYFTSRIDLLAGFGFDYNHVGTPRTYGITAGVNF